MKAILLSLTCIVFLYLQSFAQRGSAVKLSGQKVLYTAVKFSPVQDKILIGSAGNWAKLWNLKSNSITVLKHASTVNSVAFSPNGADIATGCSDNNAYLWRSDGQVDTFAHVGGKVDFTSLNEYGIGAVVFSPNGETLATGGQGGIMKRWHIDDKTLVGQQSLGEGIKKLAMQPDGSLAMIGIYGNHNFMNFEGKTNKYTDLIYSPDGSFAVLSFRPHLGVANIDFDNIRKPQTPQPGGSYIYRIDDQILIKLGAGDPSALALSPDNKYVAVGERNGKISLYNQRGQLLYQLNGHQGQVLSISFARDSKRFVTAAEDGVIKLWEVGAGNYLAELHPSGEADKLFTIALPSGYYFNVGRQVDGIILNGTSYSFNDSDARFNRPDLVMKALGYVSARKLANYEKAYQKRISLLKLADRPSYSSGKRPEITVDRSEVRRYSFKKEISFTIKASSDSEELAKLQVKVNGIPVNGRKGFKLSGSRAEKRVTVELGDGKNTIVSEVITQSGRISLTKKFLVVYESDKKLPNLYFVGIGSGKFRNTIGLGELNASSDIQNIRDTYLRKEGVLFDRAYHKTLIDEEVNVENVRQLGSFLKNAGVDDLVVFYYTGHGILDEEKGAYYLSTYDISEANPQLAGLNYDDVEDLLDNIASRKKLVMINACKSGEYDEDEEAFELMKKTFVDLRGHSGAFVISSSTAYNNSFAQLVGDSEDVITVFTDGLLKVFAAADKNGKEIYVNEIRDLLYDTIRKKQKPEFRRENTASNFRIW